MKMYFTVALSMLTGAFIRVPRPGVSGVTSRSIRMSQIEGLPLSY
jgi:hypothetical protein